MLVIDLFIASGKWDWAFQLTGAFYFPAQLLFAASIGYELVFENKEIE